MTLTEIFQQKYKHIPIPSPHYKNRPSDPDGIVVHSMGEKIEGNGDAHEFLEAIGLSAHKLIKPNGNVIECVPAEKQAYHAGVSRYGNQTNLNTTFVGIEILIEGEYNYSTFLKAIKKPDSFTHYQFDSTAVECALLMQEYPKITLDRIVRHSDVSGVDVRPTDPKKDVGSGFDWESFKTLVKIFKEQLDSAKD